MTIVRNLAAVLLFVVAAIWGTTEPVSAQGTGACSYASMFCLGNYGMPHVIETDPNCGNGWKSFQCCPEQGQGQCLEEEFACCGNTKGGCADPELPDEDYCPTEQCGNVGVECR